MFILSFDMPTGGSYMAYEKLSKSKKSKQMFQLKPKKLTQDTVKLLSTSIKYSNKQIYKNNQVYINSINRSHNYIVN